MVRCARARGGATACETPARAAAAALPGAANHQAGSCARSSAAASRSTRAAAASHARGLISPSLVGATKPFSLRALPLFQYLGGREGSGKGRG